MQTDTIFAHEIENNDFVLNHWGVLLGYVYSKEDVGDYIHIDIVDEDAEHTIVEYAPFDPVEIVTSFWEED